MRLAIVPCTTTLAAAQTVTAPAAPEVGKPLPAWSRGVLDIHQISTGRGNSAFFILPDGTTLQSPVMILPAWSVTHPSQDSLKRMLAKRLYPGPHDVFVTTLREPAKAGIGPRVDPLKAQHGHIVVRVEPGGPQYRVFALDDTTSDAAVSAFMGRT